MSHNKAKWEKPQLIVLVRGKPEEAVLVICKTAMAVAGPWSVAGEGTSCYLKGPLPDHHTPCESSGSS